MEAAAMGVPPVHIEEAMARCRELRRAMIGVYSGATQRARETRR